MNGNPYQQGTYGTNLGNYHQGYGQQQQQHVNRQPYGLYRNTVYPGGIQVGIRDGDPTTYFVGPGGGIVKTVNNPGAW